MENGYSICLNKWALDKDIKSELGLLLIISSLSAQEGYCYAKNDYFSNLFGITETSVSLKLKKLQEKGYITTVYTKRGAEVIDRKIYINIDLRIKKSYTDELKKVKPTNKKNLKYNNIINNNIINNNIYRDKKFKKPTLEEVEEYCKSRNNNVDAKSFYEYFEAGGWKDSQGKQVKNWKQKVITWENYSKKKASEIEPSWLDKDLSKELKISKEEELELKKLLEDTL